MSKMRKEKTTLIERENDWLWLERFLPYPTAADALKAVQYDDIEAQKVGVSTIRTIDWEATTLSGKYAVLALTAK